MLTKRRTIHLHRSYEDKAQFEQLEYAARESDTRERLRIEKERIAAAKAKAAREKLERDRKVAAQRDREAEEIAAQLKVELKRRYLATGVMTSDEFEQQWPRIKAEHLEQCVDAHERALRSLPIYANML